MNTLASTHESPVDPDLEAYLARQYHGVLDASQLERHVQEYVGLDAARANVAAVRALLPGRRLLDVGCGFGTFVLACREAGFEAEGIDLAPFEIEFAKGRLRRARPDEDPDAVYRLGDGGRLPYADAAFDGVTLWNVLEHVPDPLPVLREAARVVRPGGLVFSVCPNYASFREEAHYHVAWPPLLPRALASRYLRARGKDPRFFEGAIHYRTNTEVLRTFRRAGLRPDDPRALKLADPSGFSSARGRRIVERAAALGLLPAARVAIRASFRNPWRRSIVVAATRSEDA